jgi:RNA polymerase sigma factor (TIGR02999 family)
MDKMPQQTITRLLQNYQGGDKEAFDVLFEHVYKDLYKIARGRRREWQGNNTLNTTALLHEAYLKLVDQSETGWQSRVHFYAAASKAMRHILINYARDRMRKKRGGDQHRVTFGNLNLAASGKMGFTDDRVEALELLGNVLERLDELNPRQCRIVECRFFGGMTIRETAEALGVSPITVTRGWQMAQLWLYREMKQMSGT